MRIVEAPRPQPTSATRAPLFRVNTAQSRNPAGNQVGGVTRTEKAFGADKKFVMMFVPTQTFSGLESFRQLLLGFRGSQSALKSPGQEDGTAFIGHREGLFLAHMKLAGRRIVVHIAARGLVREPFPDVALGGIRF